MINNSREVHHLSQVWRIGTHAIACNNDCIFVQDFCTQLGMFVYLLKITFFKCLFNDGRQDFDSHNSTINDFTHGTRMLLQQVLNCKRTHPLRWRHNGRDSVSNHQPHDCLLHRLFRRRSKKTSKLRVTGLCVGNSPGTGEFPAQMASYAENVSIWWRHHVKSTGPDSSSHHE